MHLRVIIFQPVPEGIIFSCCQNKKNILELLKMFGSHKFDKNPHVVTTGRVIPISSYVWLDLKWSFGIFSRLPYGNNYSENLSIIQHLNRTSRISTVNWSSSHTKPAAAKRFKQRFKDLKEGQKLVPALSSLWRRTWKLPRFLSASFHQRGRSL